MSDYTSLSRSEWLDLADTFYSHLDQTMSSLTPADWNRPTRYLGWRARDVLAHMTSAMPVNFREVLDRALADNPSAPPEFNTFARNAREVERRRTVPVAEILAEFRSELDALLTTYRSMSDEEWLKPAWFFVGTVNVRSVFLVQFGDNLFHNRDLLLVKNQWTGLDPEYTEPVVDWFMRELRPANFRPEHAGDLRATALYRLTGAAGGEWTMTVADGTCTAERGAISNPDVTVEGSTEDVVAAAQARAAPFFGWLARRVDWVRGAEHAEDVVASITAFSSLLSAVVSRRMRISGERAIVNRLNRAFWHFGERSEQTEATIARTTVN